VYKQAFQETNFGLASAIAVIGGIILIGIGIIGLRLGQSKQTQEV
jgi:ABC-type sugar transport system permease subunit